VVLDGSASAPVAYGASKVVQFALPLLALGLPAPPKTHPLRWWPAIALGLAAGIGLAAVVWWLAPGAVDGLAVPDLEARIAAKLENFHLATPTAYLFGAVALSLVHSGLEELYWRWFLYGGLRRNLGHGSAMVLSTLGFAAHHVVVIVAFVGPSHWPAIAVGTGAVLAAGVLWCELYRRTGRLVAPWLAHVGADIAVLALGFTWVFPG
jgi:membrane protease YdiL (CAAX protease family)